jgi:hypothetical protein
MISTSIHACKPTYSGGRDQVDGGLKPAHTNIPQDPVWYKAITKKKKRLVDRLKV